MWKLLRFALLGVVIQGCAHNESVSAPQLDCQALNTVVDAAQDNFVSLTSGSRNITRYGNTWQTRVNAYGSDCTLLSGTDTPRNYFCSIPDRDQSTATRTLADAVESCLGPHWQRRELPRPATRFSRAEDNVVVDVGASDVTASRATVVGLVVRRLDNQSERAPSPESVAQQSRHAAAVPLQ